MRARRKDDDGNREAGDNRPKKIPTFRKSVQRTERELAHETKLTRVDLQRTGPQNET